MSESIFRKSRLLPLAAIGASALAITGCRALGWAESKSFVMSCPPQAPNAKVAQPQYTDVPNSFKNKLKIDAFCEGPGTIVAPSRVEAGSSAFPTTQPGETEYTFTIGYSVDSTQPPATVQSIEVGDAANPASAEITMEGMYSYDWMTGPTVLSATK